MSGAASRREGRRDEGLGAVGALAALAILAVGCTLLAASTRTGLQGSVAARATVGATMAATDAMERLLAWDWDTLVAAGSGTLAGDGTLAAEWQATRITDELAHLTVTLRWQDTRPRLLVLGTAVERSTE